MPLIILSFVNVTSWYWLKPVNQLVGEKNNTFKIKKKEWQQTKTKYKKKWSESETFWNDQLLLNWPFITTIQLLSMSMTIRCRPNAIQGHLCIHVHVYIFNWRMIIQLTYILMKKKNCTSVRFLLLIFTNLIFYS